MKPFRRRQIAATPADALAGLTGFADVEAVAAGASSEVFRARQPDFDRVVAVKVFSVTLSDKRTRERFAQELAVTGRLDGLDNIVVVHDRGITPSNHPYLVMRWYDGGSLAEAIAAEGPLAIDRVLRLGVRMTSALAEAHGRSVVHRDLKPANVLLTARDEPVLADFGVSTLTSATTAATRALTPVHAAPEMFNDAAVDERSDIWSMGSTLYTALAARPPFAAPASGPEDGLLPMLLRLANEPLPPLIRQDVPASLWAVLERSMAKQPHDRYASAAEMAVALQDVQRDLGLPVTEALGLPCASPERPRRSAAVAAPPSAPAPPRPPVDEGTMLGSGAEELARRAAAAAPGRSRWTRGKIAAIVGGAVAVVVLAVVLVGFATGGSKKPSPAPGPSATTSPSAGRLPAGVSPPTGVHVVTSTSTSIALAWTDSNGGRLTYVVLGGPSSQVARSKTAATVTKLSPKTAYCLRVAAVYSVSGGLAPSAPVCVTTP